MFSEDLLILKKTFATRIPRCGCSPGLSVFQNTCGTHYPFSFFDDEAFRFHLPAYLYAAIDDLGRADELVQMVLNSFDLSGLGAALLNRDQCLAISACIAYYFNMGAMEHVTEDEFVECHEFWLTRCAGSDA